MSSPEEIADVLARLLERQDAVEQRLLRVESAMGLVAAPAESEPVHEAVPPPLPPPMLSTPPAFTEVAAGFFGDHRQQIDGMARGGKVRLIAGILVEA